MEVHRYKDSREIIKGQGFSEGKSSEDREVLILVEKAAKGQTKAFEKLYDIYIDRIYRYIYYQVRDRAVTEDLTQQVFMKAWEAISKYEWRGKPFAAWLFRIAHNNTVDYYRSIKKDDRIKNQVSVYVFDPETDIEKKLIEEELLEAVSGLPPQQREVIILKFIDGLDNHQISEIMGKKEGAIRVMQMRALSALRQKLSGVIS